MKKHFRMIAWIAGLCLIPALTAGCAQGKARADGAPPEETQAPAPAPVSAPEPRDPSLDLLLVVDFQNVYLPGNDWACPSMPQAMANTMRILDDENAPDCVMTKFLAPEAPVGRWQQYNETYREINENGFLAEFPEALKPYAEKATVVAKSTYSSMDAPEVAAAMEGKRAVVLCGVVADCCVLATMMDAIDMGYEVVYLYDCIGGVSEESEAEFRALAEIFSPIHTSVMSSDAYLAAIAPQGTGPAAP